MKNTESTAYNNTTTLANKNSYILKKSTESNCNVKSRTDSSILFKTTIKNGELS